MKTEILLPAVYVTPIPNQPLVNPVIQILVLRIIGLVGNWVPVVQLCGGGTQENGKLFDENGKLLPAVYVTPIPNQPLVNPVIQIRPTYHWLAGVGACSATCGGGTQSRNSKLFG